jgi:uncharacterized SAM-binding protein YcdF (DUF218 family)
MTRRFVPLFLQAVGFLTILSALVGGLGFCLAGYWLDAGEEPVESDAIVVLSGEFSRPLYAADLYHKGYAPIIYVGRPEIYDQTQNLEEIGVTIVRHEERYEEILVKKNVPKHAIAFFGNRYVSTVEEAESLKRVIGNRPVKLLVITSLYHTRRARAIFRDVLPNAQICTVATPYEDFFKRKWWTDRDSSISVVLETAQTLYYHLGGAFRSTYPAPNP